jgi:hypothetical protein
LRLTFILTHDNRFEKRRAETVSSVPVWVSQGVAIGLCLGNQVVRDGFRKPLAGIGKQSGVLETFENRRLFQRLPDRVFDEWLYDSTLSNIGPQSGPILDKVESSPGII